MLYYPEYFDPKEKRNHPKIPTRQPLVHAAQTSSTLFTLLLCSLGKKREVDHIIYMNVVFCLLYNTSSQRTSINLHFLVAYLPASSRRFLLTHSRHCLVDHALWGISQNSSPHPLVTGVFLVFF